MIKKSFFLKAFTYGLAFLGLVSAPIHSASAATVSGSLVVTAAVLDICLVVPAPLAFGTYSLSAATDATAAIVVTCTLGTGYTVAMNGGTTANSISGRQMQGLILANRLDYQLYSNAGRTTVWGDGTTGNTVAGTGSGLAQTLTVYGRIPLGQSAAPDAYTDTVSVTLTY